jgi:hypothetical protein
MILQYMLCEIKVYHISDIIDAVLWCHHEIIVTHDIISHHEIHLFVLEYINGYQHSRCQSRSSQVTARILPDSGPIRGTILLIQISSLRPSSGRYCTFNLARLSLSQPRSLPGQHASLSAPAATSQSRVRGQNH